MTTAILDIELAESSWSLRAKLACIVVLDVRRNTACVFEGESSRSAMNHLRQYQRIIGFNHARFDLPRLQAHSGIRIGGQHYDLHEKIREQVGMKGGWTLDSIMQGMLGVSKSIDGADIPRLWQSGRRLEVLDHCIGDTFYLLQIMRRMVRMNGRLTNAAGRTVRIDVGPLRGCL